MPTQRQNAYANLLLKVVVKNEALTQVRKHGFVKLAKHLAHLDVKDVLR